MQQEDSQYRSLMDYALRALSQRAHTVSELRTKLQKKPHHTQALEDHVIARLLELKLLDDASYIRRRIENAVQIRYEGQFKVAQKLFMKGIPLEQTRQLWADMKINEREVARQALKKVSKRFQNLPAERLFAKRAQFLAGRGFAPDIVMDLAKSHEID